jgi:hypothetical protein
MTIIRSTKLQETIASSSHHDPGVSPKSVVPKHISTITKSKFTYHKRRDVTSTILYKKFSNESCIPYDDTLIQSLNSHRRFMRRGSRAPSMMFQLEVTAAATAAATALHEQEQEQQLQYSMENGKCDIDMHRNRNDIETSVTKQKNMTKGQGMVQLLKQQQPQHLYHHHRKNNTSLMTLLGLQLQESVSIHPTIAKLYQKQNKNKCNHTFSKKTEEK